jgi:hypothetical protein
MRDPADHPRRYADDEVRRLLERASEIQAREGTQAVVHSGGFSLAELEEIAAEAGISPAHMRQAAAELESRAAAEGDWTWATGEPVTLVRERFVSGELPADAFESLVMEIQRSAGLHGQPSLMGRTLTWQADTPSRDRSLQVMIASRDGRTRIRVEERLHQLAGGLFGGMMGGVGGGLGVGVGVGVGLNVLGSALFAVAAPLGVVGLSFLAARGIFSGISRRRQRALDALMTRLVAEVEQGVEAAAVEELPPNRGGLGAGRSIRAASESGQNPP